jgi:hypothetical protein
MHKLAFAVALAAAIFIPGSWSSSSAIAHAGSHRHPHPPVWGDGDWTIVRWSYGDCKVWRDDNGPPIGTDWVVLADGFPTWDAAWGGLVKLQGLKKCA